MVIHNRDAVILRAAVEVAAEIGYQQITRERVAEVACCAPATINLAFGSMRELKDAMMRFVVEDLTENGPSDRYLVVLGQGLANRHPEAATASQSLKDGALQQLAI